MDKVKNHISGWLYESQSDFELINELPRRQTLHLIYPPPPPLEFVPLLTKRMDRIVPKILITIGCILLAAAIIAQIARACGVFK
jgi:hypothetical protein